MKTQTEDIIEDMFEPYLGKVVEVYAGRTIPLYGVLVRLSPLYIAIERRDGRVITISRDIITTLQPTRTQFNPDRPRAEV